MKRVGYLIREALTNIRVNQAMLLIVVVTTAFTRSCFGKLESDAGGGA